MSEYMNLDRLGVLIGESTEDEGILGRQLRACNYRAMILWDEIEKAHTQILDLLLQILSAARITFSTHETVNLENCVIAATTNIGSLILAESRTTDRRTIQERTINAARRGSETERPIRTEILNRFDLLGVFNKLSEECDIEISKIQIREALKVINGTLGHNIEVDANACEHIRREGYTEYFGAREVQRKAMAILSKAVRNAENGSKKKVTGTVMFDPRKKLCFVKKDSNGS